MHSNYLCMYTEVAADEEWIKRIAIIIASESGMGVGVGEGERAMRRLEYITCYINKF